MNHLHSSVAFVLMAKVGRTILVFCLGGLILCQAAMGAGRSFDVRDYGAEPNGKTLCTAAIQKAIDAAAASGGSTVQLAGGKFLSGTIYLRSHVTLEIAAGATLLGSTNLVDYPINIPALRSYTDTYVNRSLIAGENLENVAIVGRGVIDGQGSGFQWTQRLPPFLKDRPYVIRLVNCRDVLVEGVRLQDSPMWMQHYLGCEGVTLRGIRVYNYRNQCNDGLDLDSCRDCVISGCVFDSDDDGITLKSTCARPCENVVISDCTVRSHCNAIKMGTESNGGFKNITITNCTVSSPPPEVKTVHGFARGIGGIALEIVDGGHLERVTISNIAMQGVNVPIFLRLGDRARPFQDGMTPPPVGSFRDVAISNIVATDVGKVGCSITGLANAPIENVSLSNIILTFDGGGPRILADKKVDERAKNYPECMMFGDLPAYGFYCRHVKGLRFSNVQLRTATPDLRHVIVCDDVERLAIDGLDAVFSSGGASLLKLVNTRAVIIRGCQPRVPDGTFVTVSGGRSRDIAILANDLRGAGKPCEATPDVPQNVMLVK